MPGFVTAEIQAWGKGDVLGFQKMLTKREGITAKRADVGIQVKRTFRLNRNAKAQLAQGRQQEIATTAKLGPTLFQNRQGLRFEAGQCCVLGHAWRADIEILCEFLQVGHCLRRRHQPAQAPAGHAEILGKTIKHKRAVINFQHTRRITAIGQAVIDLIHHQMPIAGLDRCRQGCQFVTTQQCAGRIGRGRHQRAYAVLVPVAFDQFGCELIAHIGAYRHQLGRPLYQTQEMSVTWVAWVC